MKGPLAVRFGLAAVAVAIAAAELVVRGHSLEATAGVVSGLLVLAIVVVVGRGVLRQGVVNEQSVIGAICIYLLLGMLFVFIYSVVAVLGSGPFFVQGTDGTPALRMYFSFVTLTTVGYGDFTAKTNVGHTLSVTEALLGQLYLVTVVALLVSKIGADPDPGGQAPPRRASRDRVRARTTASSSERTLLSPCLLDHHRPREEASGWNCSGENQW